MGQKRRSNSPFLLSPSSRRAWIEILVLSQAETSPHRLPRAEYQQELSPIETALIGILRAILWTAKNLLGAPANPATNVSVNRSNNYVPDAEFLVKRMREDTFVGLVPRCRYLSFRYGISEAKAHRLMHAGCGQSSDSLAVGVDCPLYCSIRHRRWRLRHFFILPIMAAQTELSSPEYL